MIKKSLLKQVVGGLLVSTLLVLGGCGDSSDAEDRMATQQMLDDGNYAGVISKLDSSASTNDEYLSLAAAYMGKAGYSLLEIINAVTSDKDNMVSSLASKSSGFSSTLDLDKATLYYKKVVGERTCDKKDDNETLTLNTSQKDVCLFIGLSAVSKVASTVSLLVDDIGNFGSDTNNTEDFKLTATTCAMKFAFDNNETNATSMVDVGDCNITVSSDVNFTVIDKLYRPIVVTVDGDTNSSAKYYYLMTAEDNATKTRQTVLTSGYCSNTSFTPRVDDYNSSLYACPINESKDVNETTSMDVLVEALNGGLDSVTTATATDDNSDTQDSIDEFKCEVLGGTYNSDAKTCIETGGSAAIDVKQDVNESQVIDYLSEQNGGN